MQVRGQVRERKDTRVVEERKPKRFIRALKFMQFVNKCTNENIRVNTKNVWLILQFFIFLLCRQIIGKTNL